MKRLGLHLNGFVRGHGCCPNESMVLDPFLPRHTYEDGDPKLEAMLETMELESLDELISETIPEQILFEEGTFDLGFSVKGETATLAEFKERVADQNNPTLSLQGTGYYPVILPSVIQRNVLENPAWYTPYTPYQAEISQGRLESLLNFQTMISSLTGLPVSNSSLLDEGTAAGEAMFMSFKIAKQKKTKFLLSSQIHPQTIEVVKTRAYSLGVEIVMCDTEDDFIFDDNTFGCIVQYPDTNGKVSAYEQVVTKCHEAGATIIFATDLLALTVLTPPGELGADIVIGSNQRFGLPMMFGGPSAGYLVTKDELKRNMPGRVIGTSIDSNGKVALRMALQTREQHIRREKATSNICTASALMANVSAFYAVYHGPEGLGKIGKRIHSQTMNLIENLKKNEKIEVLLGEEDVVFDTFQIKIKDEEYYSQVIAKAKEQNIEFREFRKECVNCEDCESKIGISLNEAIRCEDLKTIMGIFGVDDICVDPELSSINGTQYERTSKYLEEPVFNKYHTEHDLLRYMYRLETKDVGLTTSLITLGSCTMKLNSTSSMVPITMPNMVGLHPHTDLSNAKGYMNMITDLEDWLCRITSFDAISLQPNSGAAGEYTGIRCIKAYHESNGDFDRNICLTPISAHGTNPATLTMTGMNVVTVKCDDDTGNVNLEDLYAKAEEHAEHLAGIMITYPSTYGIFEEGIMDVIDIVHSFGGQVYMDGANMNAQVGFTSPGHMGADVCHLNLHKTFSIPHGGGGPGIGPIGVKEHLKPFLPTHYYHDIFQTGCCGPAEDDCKCGSESIGPIASSPWGYATALSICWMYIKMLGTEGLQQSTKMALLNSNYMVKLLENDYDILYRGERGGRVGHEFILDARTLKKGSKIESEDIAKRLMDYGFHAPTLSFPVGGTLMVEPTESESKEELDRFCDALLRIREEIREIEDGKYSEEDNVLKNAPHAPFKIASDDWDHEYTREKAAYPVERLRYYKFWPAVGRIDSAFGDRNFNPKRLVGVDDLEEFDY